MSLDSRSLSANHWEAIAAFLEPSDLEALAETSPYLASVAASAAPEVSLNAERSLALRGVRGAMSAAGYREGLDATEDVLLQSGFDQGFVRGAHETFRSGVQRGSLAALALFAPSSLPPTSAAALGELTLDAKAVEVPGFYRPGGDGYPRLKPEPVAESVTASHDAAARVDAAVHTRPGVPMPRIAPVVAACSAPLTTSSSSSSSSASHSPAPAPAPTPASTPAPAPAPAPVRTPAEVLVVVERVETALALAAAAADAAAAAHAREEIAGGGREGGHEHAVPIPAVGFM